MYLRPEQGRAREAGNFAQAAVQLIDPAAAEEPMESVEPAPPVDDVEVSKATVRQCAQTINALLAALREAGLLSVDGPDDAEEDEDGDGPDGAEQEEDGDGGEAAEQ